MASDEFEAEEVDRLVSELAAPLKPLVPAPAAAVDARTPPPPPPPTDPGILVPGRRWSTVRLHMPAARSEPRPPRAFLSAITLPMLPAIPFPKLDDTSGALSARVFVALGVLLSAAMPYWPYANAWSWGLVLYLTAVMLLLVTGIWATKLTWDARLPAAHTVAIGVVVWSVGLIAAEVVPRVAYA